MALPNIKRKMNKQNKKKKSEFRKRLSRVCSWFSRFIQYISVSAFIALTNLSSVAFANNNTQIMNNLKNAFGKSTFKQIYTLLASIAMPIAAVLMAINAFQLMFGEEYEAAASKKRMIIIGVSLALVLIAPLLMKAVKAWFPATASGWVDSTDTY